MTPLHFMQLLNHLCQLAQSYYYYTQETLFRMVSVNATFFL